MLLTTIRDKVLVESGNLFLADLSMLGINASQFLTLVRNSLDYWKEYRYYNGSITLNPDSRVINFQTMRQRWLNYLEATARGENPDPVPRVDHIPTMVSNVKLERFSQFADQPTASYQYEKPELRLWATTAGAVTIEYSAYYEVTEVASNVSGSNLPASAGSTTVPDTKGKWNPNVIPSIAKPREVAPSAPEDELAKWEIAGLESCDRMHEFIQYVTAKFLISLGRSRRSFQMADMPIQLDASEMVSEGQELLSRLEEQIHDTSDVYDMLLETPRAGWG